MKDMRLGRTLYLLEELEKQGSPPGGRAALLAWINAELDAGESDRHDPAPGDRTMLAIIERYPSYLKGLETRALSADEIDALKRDAEQSGRWMKAEIQRRKGLESK